MIWSEWKVDFPFFRKTVDLSAHIWYNMAMNAEKLRKIYEKAGADALFLECDFLRRYLTGFYATDGFVVLTQKECAFFADPRYFEAAEKVLKGTNIHVFAGAWKEAKEYAETFRTWGVPYPFTSMKQAGAYQKAGHTLVDCMPALEEAMIVKSEGELALIQAACGIAEQALSSLLPELKEGMEEREAAALLEYKMRGLGAEGTSFETIVAFGENGSVPHYETGARKLKFGDPVLIDFGCKVEGYCSDCTRTFLYGDDKAHEEFKKIYEHVLSAHLLALENIQEGMTGREADAIARGYLEGKGLGKYFTHSLGHGVGLQIHEAPFVAPRSEAVLKDGMVFSDEPGVYMAGKLGIRIEDTLYMEGGRAHSFMKGSKQLLIL